MHVISNEMTSKQGFFSVLITRINSKKGGFTFTARNLKTTDGTTTRWAKQCNWMGKPEDQVFATTIRDLEYYFTKIQKLISKY